MCYKGKCLYCIPIKPACLVLAIINAVVNGLFFLWYVLLWGMTLLVFGSLGGHTMKIGEHRWKRDVSVDSDLWGDISGIWWIFLLPIFALVNFIFSVLLCDGICNSRPKHVNAYFWYGIVATILATMALVVLLCIGTEHPYAMYSETSGSTEIFWLIGCVLHSLFLVMVHQTHKKVVEDAMRNGHVRLDDHEFSDEKHLIKV